MSGAALYARILGPAWDDLPPQIRDLHDTTRHGAAHGRASVERGRGRLARMVAAIVGFPPTSADVAVQVRFDDDGRTETWRRSFGVARFATQQFAGPSPGLMCERFGPIVFVMELAPTHGRLTLIIRRWRALGIPLPMWLAPRSNSYESVEDGRFHFHVEIGHPLTGPIVRYRGWLVPDRL